MNKRHKTKEGVVMFISEMDDTHLLNYVLMALKAIDKIKAELRKDSIPKDKFTKAMYTFEAEHTDEELSDMLNHLCDNLYPYMAEVLLRDISLEIRGINVKTELQQVFERNSKIRDTQRINSGKDFELITDNLNEF